MQCSPGGLCLHRKSEILSDQGSNKKQVVQHQGSLFQLMVHQIEKLPALWHSGNSRIMCRNWGLRGKSCSHHSSIKMPANANKAVPKARAMGMSLKENIEMVVYEQGMFINNEI